MLAKASGNLSYTMENEGSTDDIPDHVNSLHDQIMYFYQTYITMQTERCRTVVDHLHLIWSEAQQTSGGCRVHVQIKVAFSARRANSSFTAMTKETTISTMGVRKA